MNKKILLLKKRLDTLQEQLDKAEMRILTGRLITHTEITNKAKILSLRKKLTSNFVDKAEKELIDKQIKFLTEDCLKKDAFQNIYKLRVFLRKEIDDIKVQIIDFENKNNPD